MRGGVGMERERRRDEEGQGEVLNVRKFPRHQED